MSKPLMIVSLLTLATILSLYYNNSVVSVIEPLVEFQNWKSQYGIPFPSYQQEYRHLIFQKNLLKINLHNADPIQTYQMGVNQFTIYTDQQFKDRFLSIIPRQDNLQFVDDQQEYQVPNGDVDWTTKAGVTPVKNQGACGSCWAFSAVAVMESWALINKKATFDLSEQQLMDCSGSFGNQGCNGGLPYLALQYVKVGGITTESSYPYAARQGRCQKNGGSFTIPGIQQVRGCTALTTGIASRPISVTVDATNWSGYRTGIFNNCAANINHAVLLVGIVSTNWKIKNSWGAGWGEKGFIRLSPGNTCAICAYSSPFIQ